MNHKRWQLQSVTAVADALALAVRSRSHRAMGGTLIIQSYKPLESIKIRRLPPFKPSYGTRQQSFASSKAGQDIWLRYKLAWSIDHPPPVQSCGTAHNPPAQHAVMLQLNICTVVACNIIGGPYNKHCAALDMSATCGHCGRGPASASFPPH